MRKKIIIEVDVDEGTSDNSIIEGYKAFTKIAFVNNKNIKIEVKDEITN